MSVMSKCLKSRVTTGYNHVVVEIDNEIYSGGRGGNGQLGVGDTNNRHTLTSLGMREFILSHGGVKKLVAEHSDSTFLLLNDGWIGGCGDGEYGEFGDGKTNNKLKFEQIKYFVGKKAQNIFSCGDSLWVICEGNRVFRSGENSYGKLGNGKKENILSWEELEKNFLKEKDEKVIKVVGRWFHSLLLTNKKRVYSSGNNTNGKYFFIILITLTY